MSNLRQTFIQSLNIAVAATSSKTTTLYTLPEDSKHGVLESVIIEVKPAITVVSIKILDRMMKIPALDINLAGTFNAPASFPVDIELRPRSVLQATIDNTASAQAINVVIGIKGYYVQ